MEEELENIINNFMYALETYEAKRGISVKLFREKSCREGKINVEIQKDFGTPRSKTQPA